MEPQIFKITQNIIFQNNEGKVLILKHTTGNWLLPGGKINKGETWIDGLTREIKEETGIVNFKIERIIDIDSWIENDMGYYVATFIISVPFISGITLSEEHIEYAWVGLNDLDKHQFWHEKIKNRIRKALS